MRRPAGFLLLSLAVLALSCGPKPRGPEPTPQAEEEAAALEPEPGFPDSLELPPAVEVGAADTVALEEVEAEVREMFGGSELEDIESESPSFDIPITINDAVERWLYYFQTDGRENFQIYLQRAGRYEGMMRAVFRDAGLPEDLVYISLIESGFSPRAYSRARAVGLWQFISSTGRLYGLKVTYWIDERRDPILATKAAAAHLKDLYEEFGSWYLAAAAYNGGANRVRRSIRRSGSDDFWTLSRRRYFRRETRNYVPKLIAAALIAKQPEKFGFSVVDPHAPMAYELVEVSDATSIDVIAKAAGVSIDEVAELNPQILRGVTPPGEAHTLRVPPGAGQTFAVNYANVPASERVTWVQHVVRRGDTLSEIARAYGVSVASVQAANRGVHPRRLRIGQRLVIPRAGKVPRLAAAPTQVRQPAPRPTTVEKPDGPYITYRVQGGDTLWAIAKRYDVSTRDLMRWNGLRTSRIYPGDEVRIYTGASP